MSDPSAAARARLSNFWRRALVGLFLVGLFGALALRNREADDAADHSDAQQHLLYDEIYALGTLISFTVWVDDPAQRAAAGAAVDAIERQLHDFDRQWSPWGDGLLGQFNQALARGEAAALPAALRDLATRSFALSATSGGRFDPRIGNLVKLWGFADPPYPSSPPQASAIDQQLDALRRAPTGYDGAEHWGPAPGVAWDFGAIGKGEALRQASEALSGHGFSAHIINAGGNLVTSGARGDRPWRVGVRDPRASNQTTYFAALETAGKEAVVTSGDYERYFEFQGRRYHHILDPATGLPPAELRSVTVLGADAAAADAASTALFVAGQRWPEVAAAMGATQVLVVDASGALAVTAALQPRLRLQPGLTARRVELPSP